MGEIRKKMFGFGEMQRKNKVGSLVNMKVKY